MAMAIQSNFRFKAMLDLFGRLAMQPTETTMALSHNCPTWLAAPHQPLFLQPPLFSLFTLQFLQRATRDADSVEEMFSSSSETCRPEAGSSSQSEENGAKPSQSKWSDTQASVLVEEWKERVEEVEQKQPSPSSSHSHASSYATQPVQHEKNKQQSQMYIHRNTLHVQTDAETDSF